ncbi:MAG: isopentenyl-diphosphate Delta-isomerase [Candidatus Aenigmatarchaeota archaeon]
MNEMLILVDKNDKEIGFEEKEKCHLNPAKLHRAFSIFIFNRKNEMLVHKRSTKKKTWPGFWTNACCSHPRKGETTDFAAKRRLKEELGFATELKQISKFQYDAKYDEKYGENEFDYVFAGFYDGKVNADKNEIDEWKYVNLDALLKDMRNAPEKYTPWFKIALPRVVDYIKKNN